MYNTYILYYVNNDIKYYTFEYSDGYKNSNKVCMEKFNISIIILIIIIIILIKFCYCKRKHSRDRV